MPKMQEHFSALWVAAVSAATPAGTLRAVAKKKVENPAGAPPCDHLPVWRPLLIRIGLLARHQTAIDRRHLDPEQELTAHQEIPAGPDAAASVVLMHVNFWRMQAW